MARHQLIDAYLADLARRLPADTVDELADGLVETWQRHLVTGATPAVAAHAAVAEFGSPQQVADAFVAQAPGRRTARLLLATGPVIGLCWGASFVAAKAWTWHVPAPAAGAFALILIASVAALVGAATSRHSYRRTRLGGAGALALLVLDAATLAAVLLLAPALVWPMAAAIPASLARIGVTVQTLPRAR
jgi:hypothetical protein